jgi:hypothetical protein
VWCWPRARLTIARPILILKCILMKQLPGLSPLWQILLALGLGTSIIAMIPFGIVGGDAIKASDWIGFAGSVVSGAMTLAAAAAAWFAVQRQINAQIEIARQNETEVWQVLRDDLQEIAYRIDFFWRSVDRSLEPAESDQIRDWRQSNVIEFVNELPDASEIAQIEKGASSLGPHRRRRVMLLMFVITELRRKAEHFALGSKQAGVDLVKWRAGRTKPLQILLTVFGRELGRLDPDLAATFMGRTHAEIDDRSRREQLEAMWQENVDYGPSLERRQAF